MNTAKFQITSNKGFSLAVKACRIHAKHFGLNDSGTEESIALAINECLSSQEFSGLKDSDIANAKLWAKQALEIRPQRSAITVVVKEKQLPLPIEATPKKKKPYKTEGDF